MGIRLDLDQIINQVGRDKGIDRDVLIESLESAVLGAAKKHYGNNRNLEAQYNPEIMEIEVHEFKIVVDKVEDPINQISVEDAKKEFKVDCEVGDELGRKLDTNNLGRIDAQTAKQVIVQKLRDAERDIIYTEYKDRKGEMVNGIVQRFDRGDLIVNLGRTDAVLPYREQIQKERYRQGDRIKCMILEVHTFSKGPQVVLTRSHPDFVRKLFETTVPEINEGLIEVKGVAREPGERAKIAVYSNDPNLDPVGACVGIRGNRVQSIVTELKGERVDIVTWTSDQPSFVARALAPAGVVRVVVDEQDKEMEVVVADEELSLAIGKRGQNVRLASRLTGWKIDVRSESVSDEEAKTARAALASIPGIGFGEAELLYQEGYRSIKDIVEAGEEELLGLEGIDSDRVPIILEGAVKIDLENESLEGNNKRGLKDIDQLILPEDLRNVLIDSEFTTIQSLAEFTADALAEEVGLRIEEATIVVDAIDAFLRVQAPATDE